MEQVCKCLYMCESDVYFSHECVSVCSSEGV